MDASERKLWDQVDDGEELGFHPVCDRSPHPGQALRSVSVGLGLAAVLGLLRGGKYKNFFSQVFPCLSAKLFTEVNVHSVNHGSLYMWDP